MTSDDKKTQRKADLIIPVDQVQAFPPDHWIWKQSANSIQVESIEAGEPIPQYNDNFGNLNDSQLAEFSEQTEVALEIQPAPAPLKPADWETLAYAVMQLCSVFGQLNEDKLAQFVTSVREWDKKGGR